MRVEHAERGDQFRQDMRLLFELALGVVVSGGLSLGRGSRQFP